MKKLLALTFAVLLAFTCFVVGCRNEAAPAHLGAAAGYASPGVDRYAYASGTAGTYTVPTGFYVVSWWAHNTSGGGTVTVSPTGPREYNLCLDAAAIDADASGFDAGTCRAIGASIPVPALTAYSQNLPVLRGGPDELGDGTVFVFTSTDAYVIVLAQYSP